MENNKKYICNHCNYFTEYPSEWLKHINTQKHLRNGEKKEDMLKFGRSIYDVFKRNDNAGSKPAAPNPSEPKPAGPNPPAPNPPAPEVVENTPASSNEKEQQTSTDTDTKKEPEVGGYKKRKLAKTTKKARKTKKRINYKKRRNITKKIKRSKNKTRKNK